MKDKKNSDKDSSEKVTPENEEDLSEEESSETSEKKKIKPQKSKPFVFFKTSLLLLLAGVLSWTTYHLHSIIQNNLEINSKIEETVEEIHRIQSEQNKTREAIKSFQNNSNDLGKFLKTASELNNKISDLQKEVKVLQVEIKKKPDFSPPRQVQVDDIPSQNNQSAKLETEEDARTKEESEIMEKSEVLEEPEEKEESNKDVMNEVINFIEDTAGTIFQKIGNALKWIKGKIF